MGRILIVAPSVQGHRLKYVEYLSLEVRHEHEVDLLVPRGAREADELRILMARLTPSPRVIETDDFSADALARVAHQEQCDLVVAPDGDRLAIAIGVRRRWLGPPLRLLVMRSQAQPRAWVWLTDLLTGVRQIALSSAERVPGVDVRYLKAPYSRSASDARGIQDPLETMLEPSDRAAARSRFELDDARIWVAIVGAIRARKNAPAIAKALAQDPGRFGILAVGRADTETLVALDSAREAGLRVVHVNDFVDDADIDAAVLAADVVATVYENEGPSGIVAKAIALGTPLVHGQSATFARDLAYWNGAVNCRDLTSTLLRDAFQSAAALGRVEPTPFPLATPRAFGRRLARGQVSDDT